MSACFLSDLDATLINEDPERWEIEKPLVFFSEIVGAKIIVPDGFETDFASVPRLPLVYLLCGNRGRKAATVHDYLYRYKLYDRETCDAVFREALSASGEGFFISWSMWSGVRLFGWKFYKRGKNDGTANQ